MRGKIQRRIIKKGSSENGKGPYGNRSGIKTATSFSTKREKVEERKGMRSKKTQKKKRVRGIGSKRGCRTLAWIKKKTKGPTEGIK